MASGHHISRTNSLSNTLDNRLNSRLQGGHGNVDETGTTWWHVEIRVTGRGSHFPAPAYHITSCRVVHPMRAPLITGTISGHINCSGLPVSGVTHLVSPISHTISTGIYTGKQAGRVGCTVIQVCWGVAVMLWGVRCVAVYWWDEWVAVISDIYLW